MNTRDEEYIVALDQYRSITRAAEQLHVTQPTLSIFLTNLEKQLGSPLFQRIGKKIVPTPLGQAYVRHAQQILAMERDFQQELLLYTKGIRGELHIGSTYRGSFNRIPPLLNRMKDQFPQVQCFLHDETSSRLERLLEDGTVDVIYTNYPLPPNRFYVETVGEDHLLAVLPENHPAAAQARELPGMAYPYLNLKLVENETFFLMGQERAIRSRVNLAMDYCGVKPARIHPLEHIELGCQMAAEGLGVAFTMEHYVQDNSIRRPVRYFRVGNPESYTEWFVACRKSAYIPPYLTAFMHILKESAKDNRL